MFATPTSNINSYKNVYQRITGVKSTRTSVIYVHLFQAQEAQECVWSVIPPLFHV